MISNTTNIGGPAPSGPDPRRDRVVRASTAPAREDTLSTVHAENLKAALAEAPAVRAEVLERAAPLAVDPNYPPLQIIERVARLIAASQDPSAEE